MNEFAGTIHSRKRIDEIILSLRKDAAPEDRLASDKFIAKAATALKGVVRDIKFQHKAREAEAFLLAEQRLLADQGRA